MGRKYQKLGCMMKEYFPIKSEVTWSPCFPGLLPGRRSTKSHQRVTHLKNGDEASGRGGAEWIVFGAYWACGGWLGEFGVYWAYLSRLNRSMLVSGRCC